MPYGQLHYPFENKEVFEKNFPADFIAEGMDQTRGWFYSLINLGVGLFDKSPYKHVIVNGVVMAGDGRKMSKSEKNYTDPMILVEKFGADSIRFALMNSPVVVGESVSFGDDLVEEVYKKNIQRLENVVDFYSMYNLNLNQEINLNQIEDVLNRWILNRLQELVNTSVEGYESYKLDRAVSGVTQFIDDLSTWYLRRSREKLKDSDVETYATLKHVLSELSKVVAPSMPFLAERVWFAVNKTEGVELQSVHLQQYPSVGSVDTDLIKEMKNVRDTVAELLMLRQRNNVPVRQPLTKAIVNKSIDNTYFEIVKDELNVKQIEINTSLDVSELDFNLNDELIREGKQRELSREIKDKRKELGLTPEDSIKLILDADRMSLLDDEYKTLMKINSVEEGEFIQVFKSSI
jgi:isoleucyl-tRNA synthetase